MKEKIIICIFGTISRSIKFTHENHIEKIINILKKIYDVDIYVFNNNVEDNLIDGIKQNNNDYRIIKYNFFEEEKQFDIDNKISEKINKENIICKFRPNYSEIATKNAIRQMYSEEKVGIFLEKNISKYKCGIVFNPDIYLINNINLNDVKNSINNNSVVYTTDVNDASGYTNGYYIGSLIPLVKILKRYSLLKDLLPCNKDYEFLVKRTFEIYKIKRLITKTDFVKIRSNKAVALQGKMKNKEYTDIINEIKKNIK